MFEELIELDKTSDKEKLLTAIALYKSIEKKIQKKSNVERSAAAMNLQCVHTSLPSICEYFQVNLQLWRVRDSELKIIKTFTTEKETALSGKCINLFLPFNNIDNSLSYSKFIVNLDQFRDKFAFNTVVKNKIKKPVLLSKYFNAKSDIERILAAFAVQSQLIDSGQRSPGHKDLTRTVSYLKKNNIIKNLGKELDGVRSLHGLSDKLGVTINFWMKNGLNASIRDTIESTKTSLTLDIHAPNYTKSFSLADFELIFDLDFFTRECEWHSIFHHIQQSSEQNISIDELEKKWSGTVVKFTQERQFQEIFGVGFSIVNVKQKFVKKSQRSRGIRPEFNVRRFYVSKFDKPLILEVKDRKGIPNQIDLVNDKFRCHTTKQVCHYTCKHSACCYGTTKLVNLVRHEKKCDGQPTRWQYKRINLTVNSSVVFLRKLGLLPQNYSNKNFATFDIECSQSKQDNMVTPQSSVHSFQTLMSISVHDSFTGNPPTFFLREYKTEESIDVTIQSFLKHLLFLQREHVKQLPAWVGQNMSKLNQLIIGLKCSRGLRHKGPKKEKHLQRLDEISKLKTENLDSVTFAKLNREKEWITKELGKINNDLKRWESSLTSNYSRDERLALEKQEKLLPATGITDYQKALTYLKRMHRLRVVGFNSERYDLPVLVPSILKCLRKMYSIDNASVENDTNQKKVVKKKSDKNGSTPNLFAIKRGLGYMTMTINAVSFIDVKNFIAGGGLSDFAETWKIKEEKLCFPFELFDSISEMRQCTYFPAYKMFKSTLSRKKPTCFKTVINNAYKFSKKEVPGLSFEEFAHSIDLLEYITFAEAEFTLTDNIHEWYRVDPCVYLKSKTVFKEKSMKNMVDFLKYYNSQDTILLTKAFKMYCESFFTNFGVNPLDYLSLPAMAERIMWQHYNKKINCPYTFNDEYSYIHKMIKNNMPGGLATCFSRHVEIQTENEPRVWQDSVYQTPDGSAITKYISYDVNSKFSIFV